MSTEYYQPIYDTKFDEEKEVEIFLNPVVDVLTKKGSKIESVEIGDSWRDDHCECFDIDIVIDGKAYQYSDWWLSRAGVNLYHRAASGKEKALIDLKKHLLLVIVNV